MKTTLNQLSPTTETQCEQYLSNIQEQQQQLIQEKEQQQNNFNGL